MNARGAMSESQVALILDRLEKESSPVTSSRLRKLKLSVARFSKAPLAATDFLLSRYREEVAQGARLPNRNVERALVLNPVRSASGVATVTVLTKPYTCPGRCVYCPTDARAPKSYLPSEPPTMRAIQNNYDPYAQMDERLKALYFTGHSTAKIELIIKGGTWSSYPEAYRTWFVRRCFEAANGSSSACGNDWQGLEEAHAGNETGGNRIIGLTIETRPDHVTQEEIRLLRLHGVTRVELGVQSLEGHVLALTLRDHAAREVVEATRRLKDAGFKVAYHMMPNLPGATPEGDLESFRTLFEDAAYRPDAVKIYPCVVLDSAPLHSWWKAGRYRPYDEETLFELMIQMKQQIPPYVRVDRVVRDIPAPSVRAGCRKSNLREDLLRKMKLRGLSCKCIRCREVRQQDKGNFILTRREYGASGGTEIFLSFEDPDSDRLASLLRLRVSGDGSGVFVRELHTYGWQVPVQDRQGASAQHRGFGRKLMAEAERIAFGELGSDRIQVIAGVGVREYYRKLGYSLEESYMVKRLGH